MRLRQHSNGKVTLTCDRGDFAILLEDAAKSMTGEVEPIRADVIRLAKEFTEFEESRNPDSGSVYLLRDVLKSLRNNFQEIPK